MEVVKLKGKAKDGSTLEAIFTPSHGMNLLSYKKGGIQVIDESTKDLFEERKAGLGALIGPHFHRRHPKSITFIPKEEDFPHIKAVRLKGADIDPFSHGIGRYAAWNYEAKEDEIKAILKGSDTVNGIALKDIEGQNFTMRFWAKLTEDGLSIDFSVVSDTDSLVGLHYYYHLPEGKGMISSKVQPYFLNNKGEKESIQNKFNFNRDSHKLFVNTEQEIDATFHGYPDPLRSEIILDAIAWKLMIKSFCASQENSWQLYHPKEASFVCIEPISAQDPRHPNLSVSSIQVHLSILT